MVTEILLRRRGMTSVTVKRKVNIWRFDRGTELRCHWDDLPVPALKTSRNSRARKKK